MGYQDRDYTRENSYTDAAGGWGFYISPVVKGLIAANVAVFVLQIFAVRPMTEDDLRTQWKELTERTRSAYRGRSKKQIQTQGGREDRRRRGTELRQRTARRVARHGVAGRSQNLRHPRVAGA